MDSFATAQVRELVKCGWEKPFDKVTQCFPELEIAPLSEITRIFPTQSAQDLFIRGKKYVEETFAIFFPYEEMLSLTRCFVGYQARQPLHNNGGFHYPQVGYRYLDRYMFHVLDGIGNMQPVSMELRVLGLLRCFIHDQIHHITYRHFSATADGQGFYRTQYGINPRLEDGTSYTNPDMMPSNATHNLNTMMEGAVDRFAQLMIWQFCIEVDLFPNDQKNVWLDAIGHLDQYNDVVLPESMRYFYEHVAIPFRKLFASRLITPLPSLIQWIVEGDLHAFIVAFGAEQFKEWFCPKWTYQKPRIGVMS